MVQELTEKQFIERFSYNIYIGLVQQLYQGLINDPEYDSTKAFSYYFQICDIKTKQGDFTLGLEFTMKNLGGNLKDCGITKIWLSDEHTPDALLDRWNEMKKLFNKT